jgi:adenosylmethionine-8-amino-7-oxononanoate aminotransferase
VAAGVAGAVLQLLEDENLVEASAEKGERLRLAVESRVGRHPNVGDVRGRGLLVGIELVSDRATRAPFPRAARVTEALVRACRERGLLVYSGTGTADGMDGDMILLGPPFVITDDEMDLVVDRLTAAIDDVLNASATSDAAEASAGAR